MPPTETLDPSLFFDPPASFEAPEEIVSAFDWPELGERRPVHAAGPGGAGQVRCVEVSNRATPEAAHAALARILDPAPTPDQVANLLKPDEKPEIEAAGAHGIRRSSAFDVIAEDGQTVGTGQENSVGLITYRLVEFLSAPGWLVVCWHEPMTYHGSVRHRPSRAPAQTREAVWEAVERRWASTSQTRTGGDLGVLVLNELVLTYGKAARELLSWLEAWELSCYGREDADCDVDSLYAIRGAVTRFRSWLGPLNPAGVKDDLDKAWFADVGCRELVAGVDDRIGRALARLAEASKTVRAAYAFAYDEAQRRRSDRLERWGVIALVPTFIASFYGANTALPGGGTWRGFDSMIVAMIAFTCLGLLILRLSKGTRGRGRSHCPGDRDPQHTGARAGG